MTALHVLGAALIASPFIGIAAFIWVTDGPSAVLFVFGFTATFAAIVFGGAWLLST